ncbi:hypothetical protein [Octadecabacter antarcticus]|nr:hypothetical protein [Octadecabacter antarcticus]
MVLSRPLAVALIAMEQQEWGIMLIWINSRSSSRASVPKSAL